jgi:hypothetical protein
MLKTIWGLSVAILVATALLCSSVYAQTSVFLYEDGVPLSESELQAYLSGAYANPEDQGYNKWVDVGPAPNPFPQIDIGERDFERLGLSGNAIDGVYFINHGRHLVKGKQAIVLWVIRIPNANQRMASEFARDLTLSFWVDWNGDKMWSPNEHMIHQDLNIQDQFPAEEGYLLVYYLSWFDVPDVALLAQASSGRIADKDIRYLWSRSVVSYDDPDMSPDGQQIFGDYEDYLLTYMLTPVRWIED